MGSGHTPSSSLLISGVHALVLQAAFDARPEGKNLVVQAVTSSICPLPCSLPVVHVCALVPSVSHAAHMLHTCCTHAAHVLHCVSHAACSLQFFQESAHERTKAVRKLHAAGIAGDAADGVRCSQPRTLLPASCPLVGRAPIGLPRSACPDPSWASSASPYPNTNPNPSLNPSSDPNVNLN